MVVTDQEKKEVVVMGLAHKIWARLKTSRVVRFGPVSVIYRFRRTVPVTKNRKVTAHGGDGLASWLSPPFAPAGAMFFAAPAVAAVQPGISDSSKIAAIFGAGPGLGFALARRLVLDGYQVALISRQSDHLRDLALDLNMLPSGGRAWIYSCDATDERGVCEVFDLIASEIGAPSLVVYSTQSSVGGQAIDISTAAFEDCWRVNCLGGFLVAREAAKIMRPRHQGSIILIGSTSGLIGREGHLSLAVGKFGLRAITQVMARELWKDGLHVAHVVIDADIDEPGKDTTEVACDPDDVAAVIHSVHLQRKSAWASEIDVRPAAERFWEHC